MYSNSTQQPDPSSAVGKTNACAKTCTDLLAKKNCREFDAGRQKNGCVRTKHADRKYCVAHQGISRFSTGTVETLLLHKLSTGLLLDFASSN
mmetsp:Transcript_9919/g.41949  ORF Transcript_9919/g.41949 Transcript_9919/m.41949 type:complete len:92 (+) Transcript_9919:2185-2460(+)